MHAPLQPSPRRSVRPAHPPARRRRTTSLTRRLARQTPIFEISARIAVNGVLTVASLSALGHLVPYLQTQTARLDQVTQAVDTADSTHTSLKAEFDRYFDPAQASRLIQEYSGYKAPQERQIVWTEGPRP
ncbi:MAG: hypothetical protein ACHWZW_14260 [Spirulina sp.]